MCASDCQLFLLSHSFTYKHLFTSASQRQLLLTKHWSSVVGSASRTGVQLNCAPLSGPGHFRDHALACYIAITLVKWVWSTNSVLLGFQCSYQFGFVWEILLLSRFEHFFLLMNAFTDPVFAVVLSGPRLTCELPSNPWWIGCNRGLGLSSNQ